MFLLYSDASGASGVVVNGLGGGFVHDRVVTDKSRADECPTVHFLLGTHVQVRAQHHHREKRIESRGPRIPPSLRRAILSSRVNTNTLGNAMTSSECLLKPCRLIQRLGVHPVPGSRGVPRWS